MSGLVSRLELAMGDVFKMRVKEKARETYDKLAELWHRIRAAALGKTEDLKLIKQNCRICLLAGESEDSEFYCF
jgi:hypothetical protein